MEFKIPYDYLELSMAGFELNSRKDITKEKLEKVTKELENDFDKAVPEDGKSANLLIAEYHGISVETLVNSPNYEALNIKYVGYLAEKVVASLMDKLEITHKQAWAIFAHLTGLMGK